MAQTFELKRNIERFAILKQRMADLQAEATAAIPIVVAHLGLSPENEALLRMEVRETTEAKHSVVAIARSLITRPEPYRRRHAGDKL